MKLRQIMEEITGYNIGDKSSTGKATTTVTNVDPDTNKISWDVSYDINDETIYKELTKVIKLFEKIQLKNFHNKPKLGPLLKDLKTIRNKYSRTLDK